MTHTEMVQAVEAAREFIMSGLFGGPAPTPGVVGQLAGDLARVRDELERGVVNIPIDGNVNLTGYAPARRTAKAYCLSCGDYHQATAESEAAALDQVMEIVGRHNKKPVNVG